MSKKHVIRDVHFLKLENRGGITLELENQSTLTQKACYLESPLWTEDEKLRNTDVGIGFIDNGGAKGENMSYQKIFLSESLLRSYYIQGRDIKLEFIYVVKSILSKDRERKILPSFLKKS